MIPLTGSMTLPPVGRHRDDSPEALALCAKRERSSLTIKFHDLLHTPRHSAEHRAEEAA